jgi:hypothetical protein
MQGSLALREARSLYPQGFAGIIVGHAVMVLTPDEIVLRFTDRPVP